MRKIIFAGITACIMSMSFGVFAAETRSDISYDNYKGVLNISGTAESGSFVTLEILNIGRDYDDLKGTDIEESIFYVCQTVADEDGYSFSIDFKGSSGVYKALVVDYASRERNEFEISLVNPEKYETAIAALNVAANSVEADAYTKFKTVLNDNIFDLGFGFDVEPTEKALSGFYEYVKKNNLKLDESEKNTNLYKSYVLMPRLADGGIGDVMSYINDIYFESDELKDKLSALADMNKNAGAYITQKLKGRTMTNSSELNKELKIAYILGAVMYSNGYEPIVDALESYGDLVGISGTISSRACQKMNRNDYTAENIKAAYLECSESKGSGGAGSASGSSSNRVSTSKSGVSGVSSVGKSETNTDVEYVFDDMPMTHWAAKAVLWLKDRKIVSGTDTGDFEPEREVTREEFTKMLVNACGLETSVYASSFIDVKGGEWYESFINSAVRAGIVNGIGEGNFGIGKNITRQDMVVMIKRALDVKGIHLDKVKEYINFSDSDSISDYAQDSVRLLYESGIINGKGNNIFDPSGNTTRAEAAKVIYQAFGGGATV